MANEPTTLLIEDMAPAGAPPDNRFYIVLSGMIPVVEFTATVDGNQTPMLRAYMPFLKGHEHLAGQWLIEQEVPFGFRGRIVGLEPGDRHFTTEDAPNTPLVRGPSPIPGIDHPDVYAYFDLPLPRKIYFLNRGAIEIQDPDQQLLAPAKYLSGTRVFEYKLAGDFSDVLIEQLEVNPKLEQVGVSWWANEERRTPFTNDAAISSLHLLDGPLEHASHDHNAAEYNLAGRLFLGTSTLAFGTVNRTVVPDDQHPLGLSKWELYPLNFRPLLMAKMTDYLRTGEFSEDTIVSEGGCVPCCAGTHAKTGG